VNQKFPLPSTVFPSCVKFLQRYRLLLIFDCCLFLLFPRRGRRSVHAPFRTLRFPSPDTPAMRVLLLRERRVAFQGCSSRFWLTHGRLQRLHSSFLLPPGSEGPRACLPSSNLLYVLFVSKSVCSLAGAGRFFLFYEAEKPLRK